MHERDRVRAKRNRQMVADYKLKKGCTDCGYNENSFALEFDHLPGTDKWRTVGSIMQNSWRVIWAEIAKCEVVCANCHAIRTFTRMGL